MRTFTGCTLVAVVMVWLFHGWITGSVAESINQPYQWRHQPAVSSVEMPPYGGCDEAYLYPGTPGARWCAEHPFPPACQHDEAVGGPCLWNAETQGNGKGQSFWLDGRNRVHPITEVRTIDSPLADALAEGSADDATTRDWEACLMLVGPTTYVICPDGHIETS